MTLKEKLHRLIDGLPARELPKARLLLEDLRDAGSDPLLAAMAAAPDDDEPFTDDDAAAVAEAYRAVARGHVRSHASVRPRRRR